MLQKIWLIADVFLFLVNYVAFFPGKQKSSRCKNNFAAFKAFHHFGN